MVCERSDGNIVSDSYCNGSSKPATSESCYTITYSWNIGSWGSCVNGGQTRTVDCMNNFGQIVSSYYCSETKPTTYRTCQSYTYSWLTGSWGSCINGTKTRTVSCERSDETIVANSYCDSTTKPSSSASCTTYSWYRGNPDTC